METAKFGLPLELDGLHEDTAHILTTEGDEFNDNIENLKGSTYRKVGDPSLYESTMSRVIRNQG